MNPSGTNSNILPNIFFNITLTVLSFIKLYMYLNGIKLFVETLSNLINCINSIDVGRGNNVIAITRVMYTPIPNNKSAWK